MARSFLYAEELNVFRCNCLVWALWQWTTKGGYCGWRWSHYGPVWHFIWSPDLKTWWGFVPVEPKRGWLVLLFMWWFVGIVQEEADGSTARR